MATASEQIDNMIAGLTDWRGQRLAELRQLINAADPNLNENWKWGTAVWTNKANVVALAAFKEHVKVNFFKGAHLQDGGLFNAGLEAKETRSIDLGESDAIDEQALQSLVRAAVEYDSSKR